MVIKPCDWRCRCVKEFPKKLVVEATTVNIYIFFIVRHKRIPAIVCVVTIYVFNSPECDMFGFSLALWTFNCVIVFRMKYIIFFAFGNDIVLATVRTEALLISAFPTIECIVLQAVFCYLVKFGVKFGETVEYLFCFFRYCHALHLTYRPASRRVKDWWCCRWALRHLQLGRSSY